MPLGNQAWPTAHQVPVTGPVYAPPLGAGGMPAPGQPLTGPAADVWRNFTLPADNVTWPNGMARLNFASPISVLEIFAIGVDPLFISWQGPNDGAPGSYQLFHPGNGQLVEVVPFAPIIYISTGTGSFPDGTVEVIGKGGIFGVPASALLGAQGGIPTPPEVG